MPKEEFYANGTMKIKNADGKMVPFYPKTKTDCIWNYQTNENLSTVISQMESDIEIAANSGGVKIVDLPTEEVSNSAMDAYSNETLGVFIEGDSWSFTVDTRKLSSDNTFTGIPFNNHGISGSDYYVGYSKNEHVTIKVDWGDGNVSTIDGSNRYSGLNNTLATQPFVHSYDSPGIYHVTISGSDWDKIFLSTCLESNCQLHASTRNIYYFIKTLTKLEGSIPYVKGTVQASYWNNDANIRYWKRKDNSFAGLFQSCEFLSEIPKNLFKKNNHITSFESCFRECSSISSIPERLFDSNTQVTNFGWCFYKCTSLQSIPEGLFDSNTQVTNFDWCFANCTSLQSIPEGLFDSNMATIWFNYCFNGCSSIQSIPSGLFDNNTAVTGFHSCFYRCTSLQSIPPGLFDNNTAATSFMDCFYGCSSIQSIPSGLFNNNMAVIDFDLCFAHCSSLQSIPSELFGNNTVATDFYGCFLGCSSLQSIPEGLFASITQMTDIRACFKECSSLQSIPEGLFANNTAATRFYECFNDCSSLADFTLHIGSSLVSECDYFVTKKTGTTRTIYVPSGSTTQTTFNAKASSLGLTIIGE